MLQQQRDKYTVDFEAMSDMTGHFATIKYLGETISELHSFDIDKLRTNVETAISHYEHARVMANRPAWCFPNKKETD